MFNIVDILESDALRIQALLEGQRLDFKSFRITPAKLSQSLSALANTDGGEIYVGVEDDRKWAGFQNIEATNGISSMIFDMFPVQDYVNCEFLSASNRDGIVLKIEVFRTPDVVRSTSGDPYKRFGAQNRKLTSSDSIRQLEYTKGVHSYEDIFLNDSLIDVVNSASIVEFCMNIAPYPEPLAWLKKQKLTDGERASVAAYVLFSDEPQVLLPKSGIKVYRYKTTEDEGTRDTLAFNPISIEGSAIELIKSAVQVTKEKVQEIPKIGDAGLEAVVYPEDAIHEILTNAVLHRDYSANDEVHIRIFDNRIEVFSPGKLPGYVTPRNILKERFARNPKIVRIANKFPNAPNKDVGEGLNTAFERMRELKLRDPVISETDAGVTVTLFHELLASPEKLVEDYLKENGEINNSRGREICREGSENKMKRIFDRMIKAGIIERIPDRYGKATAYRLKQS